MGTQGNSHTSATSPTLLSRGQSQTTSPSLESPRKPSLVSQGSSQDSQTSKVSSIGLGLALSTAISSPASSLQGESPHLQGVAQFGLFSQESATPESISGVTPNPGIPPVLSTDEKRNLDAADPWQHRDQLLEPANLSINHSLDSFSHPSSNIYRSSTTSTYSPDQNSSGFIHSSIARNSCKELASPTMDRRGSASSASSLNSFTDAQYLSEVTSFSPVVGSSLQKRASSTSAKQSNRTPNYQNLASPFNTKSTGTDYGTQPSSSTFVGAATSSTPLSPHVEPFNPSSAANVVSSGLSKLVGGAVASSAIRATRSQVNSRFISTGVHSA